MKVVFVFPGISAMGFNSFGNPIFGYEASMIHHGLCSLSACLKLEGLEVELIDMRASTSWEHFVREVQERKPDILGITSTTVDYDIVLRCLDLAKDVNPNIVTVIGGVHPTVALNEVRTGKNIDHIISGEAEISLVDLLTAIQAGQECERIVVGRRPPSLDDLPFIDRELFDYSAELAHPFLGDVFGLETPFVTVLTSRGCMYNCSFCQPSERLMFGRTVRRRSVSNVMAELEYLSDRYNFNSLMIHDDSMTQDVNWVREFCEEYQRRGFRRPFWAQSRADFVCEHEEVLRMMAEAGLVGLSIGFESGSDRILRILRKGVSVQQNYEAAKLCKEYGIKIFANYMFGLPTETKDEVMATIHMIKQIRPDYHSCSFFTPFPGSELGEYCAENNLRITEDYSEYNRGRLTPKIRGVDYEFLLRAVDDARQLSSIGRFLRRLQRTSLAEEVIKWGAHFFPSRVLLIGLMRFMRHQTGRWGE